MATATKQQNVGKAHPERRYHTSADVAGHHSAHDCWVIYNGGVYDLSHLIEDNTASGKIDQIVKRAGEDVSDWGSEYPLGAFDDDKYRIGSLASATTKVTIMNLLAKPVLSTTLEVPVDETIAEIEVRYKSSNFHTGSYTWKRLGKPLVMNKTLDENGMPVRDDEYRAIGMNPDDHIPVIHLYFSDDLTEA